jgi:hypothetical protein
MVLRVFSILLSFEKGLTLPVLLIAIAFPWSEKKRKKVLSVYADNGYLPTPRSVIIPSLE